MLVASDISLIKLYFSVSRGEQRSRFIVRQIDPVRQWKLSPTDLASLDKWEDYTEAKEVMFLHTDTTDAPWTVIKSNDKKRARLAAMQHVLSRLDYADKNPAQVGVPDPLVVGSAADVLEDETPVTAGESPGPASSARSAALPGRLLRVLVRPLGRRLLGRLLPALARSGGLRT